MTAIAIGRARGSRRRPPLRGLLFPAIVFLVVTTQVPFLVTLFLATRSWNLLRPDRPQQFVGINNFIALGSARPSLGATIVQTVILTGSVVVISLILGLLLALLIHQRLAGRAAVRTLLITPMLIMPVVAGLIWKRIVLDGRSGVLPWVLQEIGVRGYSPLTQQPMFWIIVILVWQWAPFAMIILLSGLSSRSTEAVEAARLDGAGAWQMFRYITLPHLRSYLAVAFLLSIVLVLPTFGAIYITTAGGPGYATTNLAYAVFQQAFTNYDIGKASALALVDTVLVILTLTGIFRIMGRQLVRGEEFE